MRKLTLFFSLMFLSSYGFGACTVGTSGVCEVGTGRTYSTMQACANAVAAGQNCRGFADTPGGTITFSENVSISASGIGDGDNHCTSGCITFDGNPGDTIKVQRFYVTGSYVVIKGLTVTYPDFLNHVGPHSSAGIEVYGPSTGVQIINNTITEDGYATTGQTNQGSQCINTSNNANYLIISGNTLSWCSALAAQAVPWANVANLAGTATFTASSTTLSGSGTSFSTDLQAGDWVWVTAGTSLSDQARQVASVTNDTTAVLTVAPTKTVTSGTLTRARGVGNGNPNISYAMAVSGSNILIANNDVSHSNDFLALGGNSTNIAVIGNTWHDISIGPSETPYAANGEVPTQLDAVACNETTNCNNHQEMIYFNNVTNLLIEDNTLREIWGHEGAHAFFSGGSTPGSSNIIQRFNKGYHVGSCWFCGYYATFQNYKIYNDSIVNSDQQAGASTATGISSCGGAGLHTSSGNAYVNILQYNPMRPLGTPSASYYKWYADCTTLGPPANPIVSGNNLGYDPSCAAGTLTSCTSGSMKTDAGNMWANPNLLATDGTDFHVLSGSPALAAGRSLTAVAAGDSGIGDFLIVNDATWFQDGWGIPTVPADYIRVGVNSPVQISSINYLTNTITLAAGVNRSPGDAITLVKNASGTEVLTGAELNIGAEGSGGTPTHTLTVTSAQGTPSLISPTGTSCGANCWTITAGSQAVVRVGSITAGYGISGWTGCDSVSTVSNFNDTCTINALNADTMVTANYAQVPFCTMEPSPYITFIQQGDSFSIAWTSTNATSATIDHGFGAATPVASGTSNAVKADVLGAQTYTMTATGPGGSRTCNFSLQVNKKVVPAPF